MNIAQKFHEHKKGDKEFIVLEGLHAVKHALRFNANIEQVISPDKEEILKLAQNLAPDIVEYLENNIVKVNKEEYNKIFPYNLHGQIAAIAKKKPCVENISGTIVWIENPNSINNFGATVRVLAARGVENLIISGAKFSAWHKDALRTGAGLHFALSNVLEFENTEKALDFLDEQAYKIAALDPTGQVPQEKHKLNEKICFAFGTERHGLSELLKDSSDFIYKIPMQEKVSSLNLATSVAAFLYGWVK